jgi:DNA polymerase
MKTPVAPADLARAVHALRNHVEHLRDEGVTEVEVRPDVLNALRLIGRKKPTAAPARAATSTPAPAPRPASRPAPILPPPAPPLNVPSDKVAAELTVIAREAAACQACRLGKTRTNVVPGQGHNQPEILFIGEGPGADEDEQGLAFVGRAGQLLTQIINAMGFSRDEVFIGNVVKCRPPDNRKPEPDEMAACLPFLERQIALLKPKVIVTLGATAYTGLFKDDAVAITKRRGTWKEYRGIPVMPTFHPSYLLYNPPSKREVWTDMKAVLTRLGRTPPAKV